MNLKRYAFQSNNDFQDYSFFSDGPNGQIKKVVVYSLFQEDPVIYNLAFGDENPETGEISDTVNSNNKDRDIVLVTVANTIYQFCERYGNHLIYASGSTASRTRLYQMSIARLLDDISAEFDVFGVISGDVVKFERNVNYVAFLVKRK